MVAQHNEYSVLVVHELWVGMYGVGGKSSSNITYTKTHRVIFKLKFLCTHIPLYKH